MKKASISLFFITNILLSFYANDSMPVLPITGNSLESFIPRGWKLLLSAKGDLNKDGMEDLVAIIEQPDLEKKEDQTYNSRIIYVIFKTKENYSLSVQANNTIFLAGDGGTFGDPLSNLEIVRGSFLIHYFGGAMTKWGIIARFKFLDNGWYMIGYTENYYKFDGSMIERSDYNLLTGIKINMFCDDNGNGKEVKTNRGKKKLLNLLDYNVMISENDY